MIHSSIFLDFIYFYFHCLNRTFSGVYALFPLIRQKIPELVDLYHWFRSPYMYLPHRNTRRYYMKNQTVTDKPIPSASPNSVSVNRQYKDTVFRMLFSDRNNLLALYNAVSGCNYTDAEKLTIVTLENAIYLGMKNDLAFVLDMSIYLYEHQSTVNPNIPLRDLFYISAEYNNLVKDESLYSSALKKSPHLASSYFTTEPICRLTGWYIASPTHIWARFPIPTLSSRSPCSI